MKPFATRLCKCRIALMSLSVALCVPSEGMYIPESRWTNQRPVRAVDICLEPEIEFEEEIANGTLWEQLESENTGLTAYSRKAAPLLRTHLKARLLAENGTKTSTDQLARIYHRNTVLSESMLAESVSNLGDLVNVRRAMRKLVAGQPVTIVALGGSVTSGHGPKHIRNAYLHQVYDWVNRTFPHPGHRLLNHAIPAVTSVYVSPCILDLVPDTADLVLLEFTFNDSERGSKRLDDITTRGLERMLRKLMQLPSQPGLVYLHYWAGRRMQHNFSDTVEDAVNTLLKYYGLMGLSMRDAVHQVQIRDEPLVARMFLNPELTEDEVHPSCVGSRFLADILIGHLQDLAAAELASHHEAAASASSGYEFHHAGLQHSRLSVDILAEPLQPSNWGNLTERCILDPMEFKKLVRPGEGWDWVNEGRTGSPKWGFVGRTPGSELEVDVPVHGYNSQLTLGIGFLVSFEHMGIALLECVSGCKCKKREFSFWHPFQISITSWRVMDVRILNGSTKCTLGVTILGRSYSTPPEAKVKLNSLLISEEKGFIMPWLFCDECL